MVECFEKHVHYWSMDKFLDLTHFRLLRYITKLFPEKSLKVKKGSKYK